MKKPASNSGRTAAPAKKAASSPAKKATAAPARKSAPAARKTAPPAKKSSAPAKKATAPAKKTAAASGVKSATAKATAAKNSGNASRTSGSAASRTAPAKAVAGRSNTATVSRSGAGTAGKSGTRSSAATTASRAAATSSRGSSAGKPVSRKSLSPQERRVRDRNDMDKIFKDVLKDIYYAEKKLTKALGKMAKNATHEDLKDAFLTHQEQTEGHVQKVEEAFQLLGIPAKAKRCAAMDGLVEEANEHIDEYEKGAGLDAAMITGAQKVEHYEIAAYGSLRTFAQTLGYNDCAVIFADILAEEKDTDALLSTIADTVNNEATREYEDVGGEHSGNRKTSPTQNEGTGSDARNGATQASAGSNASGSTSTNNSASNGYKTNNEDDTDAEGRYAAPSSKDTANNTDTEDSDDDVTDSTETSSAADSITS